MNNKSTDSHYNELMADLRNALQNLATKIKPKIYKYEFFDGVDFCVIIAYFRITDFRIKGIILKRYNLLLISVDSPIMLGIYDNQTLTHSFIKEGKFSETLPFVFSNILRDIGDFDIYYANGPGNFSAIKLTHIFLQSLVIAQNGIKPHKINLFCADSFHFSPSKFINAYGKIHFFKQNGKICTTTLESKRQNAFILPKALDFSIFSTQCKPLYILPAV